MLLRCAPVRHCSRIISDLSSSLRLLIGLLLNPFSAVSDDFVRQKSAAEYICRELREADEANFLDEEDMHVYGLKPMTDPLQLVCCNACKKPINDSQFAAHAELCRSFKLTEQTILDVDGSSVNRKPPRILKKKLSTSCANQATAVGERRRSESMDTSDTSVSGSRLNRQIRVTFFSNEAKGWQTHIFLYQNVLEKNLEQQKLRVSQMELLASVQLHVVKAGICGKELFQNMEILTIKILGWSTSNSSSRKDSSKELCTGVASPETSNGQMVAFQDSCQRDPSFDQMDNMLNKEITILSFDPIKNKGTKIC